MMENRFPEKTIAALKAKGHDVQVIDGYAAIMGSSQVIMIDQDNGVLTRPARTRVDKPMPSASKTMHALHDP